MVVIIKTLADIKHIKNQLSKINNIKAFNAQKFCGVVKLKSSPIDIQNKLRDEWN